MGLELPVIYKIYGGRKYLDRLDELIHGTKTAKRALRKKHEGNLIDGQKKRKSTKRQRQSQKAEKIGLICTQYSKMLLGVRYNERESNKIVTLGP